MWLFWRKTNLLPPPGIGPWFLGRPASSLIIIPHTLYSFLTISLWGVLGYGTVLQSGTDTPQLTQWLPSRRSDASRILCKSKFGYASGQVCMYIQWGPVEIQTPTQQNLTGSTMTAPPPVLWPSSILPPPSSHCPFIPTKKIILRFSKILSQCFTSLKTCVCLKLCTMELRVTACLRTGYKFRKKECRNLQDPLVNTKFLPRTDARLTAYTVSWHTRSHCEVSLQ